MDFSAKSFFLIDDFTLCSREKIDIPFLGKNIQIWIELEESEEWVSERKQKILLDFFNIHQNTVAHIKEQLFIFYHNQVKIGRILKKDLKIETIFETINWEDSQILVPFSEKSLKNYIFLLPETKWRLKRSKYCLELELLFCDNELVLLQEMTGLWTNNIWIEEYLKEHL